MSMIPDPIEHYELVRDPDTVYNVGLLTSLPSGEWYDLSSLTQPTQAHYAVQTSSSEVMEDEVDYATAALESVIFDGANYTSDETIVAAFVTASYDNGHVILAISPLDRPYTLGPATNPLDVGGVLTGLNSTDETDIKWS